MKVIERRKESIGYLCKELPRLAKRLNKKIRRGALTADKARSEIERRVGRIVVQTTQAVSLAANDALSTIAG
jgi:hypothetical protein